MRRSLLNKQILLKSLRQALVLFTLLLLPSAAWGGDPIISIFTGYDATTSTITFGNGSTGEWSLYGETTGVLSTYNTNQGLQITNSEGSYQSSFKLISNFTVSGTIALNATLCTINMGHSDSSNPTGSISIKYDPSGVQYTQEVSNLQNSLTTGNNTFKITNMPMGGNEQAVTFENNHLIIEFNNLNPGNGAFYISSIELSSELTKAITNYDLWIGGTQVNSENASNVLGDDLSGGKEPSVKFTPASSDNNNINTLTLNDASITGNIISELENLTINLSKQNSISGSISTPNQATSSDRSLSFTGNGSLSIESGAISGFKSVNTDAGLYIESDNPNLSSASNVTISSNETYPIWVYNTSTTKYTQLTANASSYTTAEANVDENHKGSVSYSANTNTLTLDNFFCKTTEDYNFVFYIGESLNSLTNSLTVDLVGTNEIYYNCFYYLKPTTSDGDLQLTYTTSSNGSLQFTSTPYYTNVDCVYDKDKGLGYDPYESTISTHWPRLEIGSTKVTGTTGEVTSGEGYYMYDDNTKTLTLSGATIGDVSSTNTDISVYLDDLTVEISGTNTIYGRFWGQYSENGSFAGKINFKNADFANASLLIHASPGLVYEFTDCQLSKDIKITEAKYNQASVDVNAVTYENGNFVYGSQKNVLTEITLSYQAPQLTVAGIEPDENGVISGDGISGTVTFTPADNTVSPAKPATLTLEDATINGYISSSIESLTVYLKGSSTITPSNTSDAPFQYTGTESTATLTFQSSEADKGSLTMNGISSIDYISGGYTIDGKNDWAHSGNYTDPDWIKEEYSTPGNKVVIWRNTQYDLQVGSYHVAESNKNQLEAFSFDSDTYTLSPISSSFDGNIISGLSKLTIEVPGKYTITGTISAKEGTDSKLEIKAGDTDMVHSLTVKNENGAIVGFSDVIITSPMKLVTPATDQPTWNVSTTEVVISDEVFYDLWVGGVHVSSGNASDIFEDKEDPDDLATASFNKTTNTLTLNEASIEVDGKNAIESGLATLNVIISGTNNIIYQGTETVAFKGIGTDNAIAFKLDTRNPGKIDIQCSNNSIIDGLKVEYEDGIGLIAIESNYYSIGKLLKPEIKSSVSEDGISVALILPSGESYIGSTMYYSITYNDEEVEDTPYDNAFTMSKPGTVTAYLVPSLGGRSGNSVGKYYGYPDAPYTMGVGDEITPAIYPAIEDNDYIGLNGSTSSNENIATFTYSDGVVKALATGTVTLTAILTGSDMSFTVLNPKESSEQSNYNYPVTFSVVVGENLNTIFAANQNFGTWYNTSDKTYKVPDGITAYIITGVDGDKVTIAETKVIPPNAPILMEKGENAKAFTYTEATDTDGSFPSGNILNYTTTDKEAVEASKLYVLYNGQFVKVTAGTKILANHCYLDLGGTSAGTRGFYNIGDGEGTTAIREVIYEGVNSEKLADGAWHDLQGRKFTTKPTKPGLYILNGKKIVIK